MSITTTRDELLGALRAHIQHDHLEHAAATLDRFDHTLQYFYWRPIWERLQILLEAWPDDELEVPVTFCESKVLRWPAAWRDERQWLSQDSILSHEPKLRLLGRLTVSPYLAKLNELALRHPEALPHVHELHIHDQHTPEQLEALLSSPLIAQITSLHLTNTPLTQQHIDALLRSPLRPKLQTLTSSHNKLNAPLMRHLGSAPWPQLGALTLEHANLDDAALASLFAHQNMPALHTLELPQNQLKRLPPEALELELKRLSLEANQGGAKLIKSLMSGACIERLEHLNLGTTELGDVGLKRLLKPARLSSLRSLHLHDHTQKTLTSKGIDTLLQSALPQLEHLELSQSAITWPQVASLLEREVMPHLSALGLSYCPHLELSGATPLTQLKDHAPLRALSLGGAPARHKAAAARLLPKLSWPKTLDTLALFGVELDVPMLDALCQHPHLLSALRSLNLTGAPARAQPIETLARHAMPIMERLGLGCHDQEATTPQIEALIQAPWFNQLLHLSLTLNDEGRDTLQPHLARHRIICWS